MKLSKYEIVSDTSVYALKDSLSCGPDNIPAYFLKRCWPVLEVPVSQIFNKIMKTGYFPKS